jgi:hypothetical protein
MLSLQVMMIEEFDIGRLRWECEPISNKFLEERNKRMLLSSNRVDSFLCEEFVNEFDTNIAILLNVLSINDSQLEEVINQLIFSFSVADVDVLVLNEMWIVSQHLHRFFVSFH